MSFRVIGIGEVLWDLLPSGPQLGGAPANFAYHAHALGARARVITRVGDDRYGREIIRRFEDMGLDGSTVQLDEVATTGTVTVALSGHGVPQDQVEVKDTVGAGDSFTAVLCLGLLCGMDLDEINAAANQIAAYVCGCVGATPSLPEPLRRTFINSRTAPLTCSGRASAAIA